MRGRQPGAAPRGRRGGRSRAFINDQPVGVGLLRQAGEMLVEIEAQFAQRGLLDPATHRQALDAFGVTAADLTASGRGLDAWREKLKAHAEAAEAARARPHRGGIAAPRARRTRRARAQAGRGGQPGRGARLVDEPRAARRGPGGARSASLRASAAGERALMRPPGRSSGSRTRPAGGSTPALGRAGTRRGRDARGDSRARSRLARSGQRDPRALEQIEERLFALRAAARKHAVPVDGLAGLRADIAAKAGGAGRRRRRGGKARARKRPRRASVYMAAADAFRPSAAGGARAGRRGGARSCRR